MVSCARAIALCSVTPAARPAAATEASSVSSTCARSRTANQEAASAQLCSAAALLDTYKYSTCRSSQRGGMHADPCGALSSLGHVSHVGCLGSPCMLSHCTLGRAGVTTFPPERNQVSRPDHLWCHIHEWAYAWWFDETNDVIIHWSTGRRIALF